MLTKIVAKRKDGKLLKGSTGNFLPYRNLFHINLEDAPDAMSEVLIDDLKAVFFVRSLEGNRAPHNRPPDKAAIDKTIEKEIRVTFRDNETIDGLSHSFHLDRLGFFLRPIDPNDNNERIFVVLSAVKSLIVEGKVIDLISGMPSEKACTACGKKLELSWKYCPFDGTKIK